jgi:hypothetical protein
MMGCYNPRLEATSFYCHPEDVPACPDGQSCIEGVCVSPGTTPPPAIGSGGSDDMGDSSNDDLATPPDLAHHHSPPHDFAMPQSPDFATPTDLASNADGGQCVPLGGYCNHNDSVCCSMWCDWSSTSPTHNTCIPHP